MVMDNAVPLRPAPLKWRAKVEVERVERRTGPGARGIEFVVMEIEVAGMGGALVVLFMM